MRFAPAAAALSLFVAVSASVGSASVYDPDPRAEALVAEGEALLAAGDTQGAIDAYEAALAVDPGYTEVYLELAEAARAEGLQGKAIGYYREAQERDPENLAAIAGEGEALVEKGAMSAAAENLAELQSLCGDGCTETLQLAAAIDRGPPVMTAEVVAPDDGVAQN
ncbi:tetratricopeptide repeat protein [Aurantiacibacter sp. MUD61]|uniref:tetratricopeptide repeat protein n=1 Tax=Aurantiacibacter sp. MUD61 TaxID=3009083 RepID=UPI0022F083D4|nr:tetratricopeptide repeat protein [Aurantiacibacter sp. MUD61]